MKIFYLSFAALLLLGCATTPEILREEEQFALVQYNNLGGNKIIIPNLDEVQFYNIYRFSGKKDSSFALIKKVKRPLLPKKGNLGPYSIEWIDYKFNEKVAYRIEGLRDSGEVWFNAEIRYVDLKK